MVVFNTNTLYLAEKHNQIGKGFVCIRRIKLKDLKVGFIVPELLSKLQNKEQRQNKNDTKIHKNKQTDKKRAYDFLNLEKYAQ